MGGRACAPVQKISQKGRQEKIAVFLKKSVDRCKKACYNKQAVNEKATEYGGIAQLGERLNGIQEVSGSIPLISTRYRKANALRYFLFVNMVE